MSSVFISGKVIGYLLLAAPARDQPDRVQQAKEKAYDRGDLQESYPAALDTRSLESAEAALQPGIRRKSVKSAGAAGVMVRSTLPSQG